MTTTPALGVDLFHLRGGDAPNNLAITPFRIFDVFYDYDTTTPGNSGSGSCGTCVDGCFTATAYGNLDADLFMSGMIYAHPDAAGNYCESSVQNMSPPITGGGGRQFDEVSRVIGADEF